MDTYLQQSRLRLRSTPTGNLIVEQDGSTIVVFAVEVRQFVLSAAKAVIRLPDPPAEE